MDAIERQPGLLYVIATLLPMASFVFLLLFGAVRNFARAYRKTPAGAAVYSALGGDTPPRLGPYVATAAIGLSCVLSFVGLIWFLNDHPLAEHEHEPAVAVEKKGDPAKKDEKKDDHAKSHGKKDRWAGSLYTIAEIGVKNDSRIATKLDVGYRID